MISILPRNCLSTKPLQILERLPNLIWAESLSDSSTERVWMAQCLFGNLLEASSVVEITFDCIDVWESGRYLPLFESVWNSFSQGERFIASKYGILLDSPSSQEVEAATGVVMLGFLFCWDVTCYSSDSRFFHLSHDDYIFGHGINNLSLIREKCEMRKNK